MTARRWLRSLTVLLLFTLSTLAPAEARAEDVTGTVERVGWWTKRLGAQPTVPPATFEVAFGTDMRPTSVAALDVVVPVGRMQSLQIALTELAGPAAAQIAHLRVCLAAPGWTTANGGAFEAAPALDCTNPADLTRSLDGNWLGDIAGLVPDGGTASLGVIVVNDLAAPISPGATVQISKITVIGQSDDSAPPPDPTTTTIPNGGATDGSFFDPSVGFVPPPADFGLPPIETPTAEATTSSTTSTTLPATPIGLAAQEFDTEATPWWRLVLLVPLSIGLGLASVHGRRLLERRGISFA